MPQLEETITWIACGEKLPDGPLDVLVCGRCCDVCFQMEMAFYEDGEWISKENGGAITKYKPKYWAEIKTPFETYEGA